MSDNFNDQKDTLLSIKHEINLLHQQVDFLLRNEKAVGLLDLDVMMNRTHTVYDKICSINLGDFSEVELAMDELPAPEEEEPVTEEEPLAEEEPEPEPEEEAKPEPEEEAKPEPEEEAKPEPEEEAEPEQEEEPELEPEEEESAPIEEELPEENEDAYFEEEFEDVKEPQDDLGFILSFEPTPDEEPETEDEAAPSVYTTGDEIEMAIPQSLADKLQHSSVNDLRSAIGINDKFLLVNELFSGSMEKYNKTLDNLNDLKTLNGALIYMNELRIELQWNVNNEAYKKLLELVHRKFD